MRLFPCQMLVLYLANFTAATTFHLYGADPEGGLWGARVKLNSTNVVEAVVEHDKFSLLEAAVDIATHDHLTHSLLVQASYSSTRNIYFGPLCHAVTRPRLLSELEVLPIHEEGLGDCVNCEVSAYALHEGKLYFLLHGEFFSSEAVSRLVQIRVLLPCEECGAIGKKNQIDFTFRHIVQCSALVSEVVRERFSFSSYDNMEVKGAKGLKVVPHGDRLTFFFQLGNVTLSDRGHDKVSISLWHADDRGHKRELHSELLRGEFSAWNIRALGSLDYNHHDICWSAGDRILCAEYSDHHIQHQRVLLNPLEAAASGVCGDASPTDIVISGVAMARHEGEVVVLFGCHPSDQRRAGVGLVFPGKKVIPVSTQSGPLAAGSLFVDHSHPTQCPAHPRLHLCLGQTHTDPLGDQPTDPPSDPPSDPNKGHLHLDLGHLATVPAAPNQEMAESDVTNDDDDDVSTDDEEEDFDEMLSNDLENDAGDFKDAAAADDVDIYRSNEMPFDSDYKYLYKTGELVQSIGGMGFIILANFQMILSISVIVVILLLL